MAYYTPLRYPGGKRRLAPVIAQLLDANRLHDIDYAEPYAGGAAVALSLLFTERAATVHINDLSRPVFAFWYTALNHTADLCDRLKSVRVNMREWERQRSVFDQRETAELPELGFAALFLNRTNRSGIIDGGVIGGKQQTGAWGLDARFNKAELIRRIQRIGRYRNRIMVYQCDALDFLSEIESNRTGKTFTFFDPPYIENSDDLYLNTYDVDGHRSLSSHIQALEQPWIVTYDDAAVRERLYPSSRRLRYWLSYSAQGRYNGTEVMFLSPRLTLPSEWPRGSRRFVLTANRRDGQHPVYGKIENVKPHPEVEEGPAAFERFRRAVKTIIGVPKSAVTDRQKGKTKKRRAATRKG